MKMVIPICYFIGLTIPGILETVFFKKATKSKPISKKQPTSHDILLYICSQWRLPSSLKRWSVKSKTSLCTWWSENFPQPAGFVECWTFKKLLVSEAFLYYPLISLTFPVKLSGSLLLNFLPGTFLERCYFIHL